MSPYNAPAPEWEMDNVSRSPYYPSRPSSNPTPQAYSSEFHYRQAFPPHHPHSDSGEGYNDHYTNQNDLYSSPPPRKRRKQLDTPPRPHRSYFPRVREPIEEPAQASTIVWDEEDTLCLVVDLNGDRVIRRCDNNMINGTKLLNAAKVSRGRRDGILKSEPKRSVTKLGQTSFKGVWIPFERALEIARAEGVARALQPLFHRDIQRLLYHEGNLMRTQQVIRSVMPKKPQFAEWLHGFPSRCSSVQELRAHARQQAGNVPPRPNYAAKPKLDTKTMVLNVPRDTDSPANPETVYSASYNSVGTTETHSPELVQVNPKQLSPYLEPSCIDVTPTEDSFDHMDDYIDWDNDSVLVQREQPPQTNLEGFDWSFYEAW